VTDRSTSAICDFIASSPQLAYLDFGHSAMTHAGLVTILEALLSSPSLMYYRATTIYPQSRTALAIKDGQTHARLLATVRRHITDNVQRMYGADVTFDLFMSEHKRWLVNDEASVRKIDSVYRNRDAGLARRKLKILDKCWDVDDETLEKVMGAVGPVCTRRSTRVGE
jgi:hypothetical protein